MRNQLLSRRRFRRCIVQVDYTLVGVSTVVTNSNQVGLKLTLLYRSQAGDPRQSIPNGQLDKGSFLIRSYVDTECGCTKYLVGVVLVPLHELYFHPFRLNSEQAIASFHAPDAYNAITAVHGKLLVVAKSVPTSHRKDERGF